MGSTENARHENGTVKKQRRKLRERKQRHQNAGVETARNGNCGTMLQGWKCGTGRYGQPKGHLLRI